MSRVAHVRPQPGNSGMSLTTYKSGKSGDSELPSLCCVVLTFGRFQERTLSVRTS